LRENSPIALGCWWDALIVTGAVGAFVWLGRLARIPPIHLQFGWMTVLFLAMLAFLVAGGWVLWRGHDSLEARSAQSL